MHYQREILLEGVKVLQAKNTKDDEGTQDAQYKARLSNDEKFVRFIGKWVCNSLVTS